MGYLKKTYNIARKFEDKAYSFSAISKVAELGYSFLSSVNPKLFPHVHYFQPMDKLIADDKEKYRMEYDKRCRSYYTAFGSGSISLQLGKVVTEKELEERRKAILEHDFLS